jgi:hypothetical protein
LKKDTSQPGALSTPISPVRRPSETYLVQQLSSAAGNADTALTSRHSFTTPSRTSDTTLASRQSFTDTSKSYNYAIGDRDRDRDSLDAEIAANTSGNGKTRRPSGFGSLLFSSGKDKEASPRASLTEQPVRKGSFFGGKSKNGSTDALISPMGSSSKGKPGGLTRNRSLGGGAYNNDDSLIAAEPSRNTFAFGAKAPLSGIEADALAAREATNALLEASAAGPGVTGARTDPNSAPPLLSLLSGDDLLAATERALATATSAKVTCSARILFCFFLLNCGGSLTGFHVACSNLLSSNGRYRVVLFAL